MVEFKKSCLSEPHKRLIEEMQKIGFGRIENLVVRDGEPVLDPMPRIVREIKLGAENGAQHQLNISDFALKIQVRDLIEQLHKLRNAVILKIEIKGGLPFSMTVEDAA